MKPLPTGYVLSRHIYIMGLELAAREPASDTAELEIEVSIQGAYTQPWALFTKTDVLELKKQLEHWLEFGVFRSQNLKGEL